MATVLTFFIVASFIVAGLGALFLLGYPSRFESRMVDRSDAERAAMIEADRRHHHLVNRGMALVVSVISGVLAIVIFADSRNVSSGVFMAAASVASASLFLLLVRRDRLRRRRRDDGSPD
ncbi:hypothetical protein KIF24_09495 [Micromonospora sp. Llam7]|uniref:hypothetical protein n=1 Tax=Micromonospora tarapacensis TaxID=2835305 RepID=UPI001C83B7F2|nr:hypothetical protein [Micromonospora tarapacensis]MBX7266230.1 hypothetical protein [Micromonospora tarapacensis]